MTSAVRTGSLLLALVIGAAVAILIAFGANHIAAGGVQTSDADSVGATIFNNRCSACHAVDAAAAARFGPSLAQIGQDAASRKPELNAAEYLLESIADPEAYRAAGANGHMPRGTLAGVAPERVRELISYLAGLGGKADKSEVAALTVDASKLMVEPRTHASLEVLRRGERLFFDELNCASCHSIYNEPGSALGAPSLAQAAKLSPQYIVQSLREPSAVIASGYQSVQLTTKSGDSIKGLLVQESAAIVTLLLNSDTDIPRHLDIEKSTISSIQKNPVSIMPAFELSDVDEAALVAFLRFLEAMIGE